MTSTVLALQLKSSWLKRDCHYPCTLRMGLDGMFTGLLAEFLFSDGAVCVDACGACLWNISVAVVVTW